MTHIFINVLLLYIYRIRKNRNRNPPRKLRESYQFPIKGFNPPIKICAPVTKGYENKCQATYPKMAFDPRIMSHLVPFLTFQMSITRKKKASIKTLIPPANRTKELVHIFLIMGCQLFHIRARINSEAPKITKFLNFLTLTTFDCIIYPLKTPNMVVAPKFRLEIIQLYWSPSSNLPSIMWSKIRGTFGIHRESSCCCASHRYQHCNPPV